MCSGAIRTRSSDVDMIICFFIWLFLRQQSYNALFVKANKKINKRGTIDSAYSNLFVVREADSTRKLSYSYADVLMNSLEITKVDNGEPLLNYEFDTSKKFVQL